MKFFGVSRASASCIGVALFAWAQAAGFCQNFGERPQMVVTKSDAYLIGRAQMLAPANADFLPNPQGRYALIMQRGAAAMPAPLLGKPETGAVSLLIYDSGLNQTRQIFQRRADGGKHQIDGVWWLPQTNCALVIVRDGTPILSSNTASDEDGQDEPTIDEKSDTTDTYTLLFCDFEKSGPPRVLTTNANGNGITIKVSPTKPFFLMEIAHNAVEESSAGDVPVTGPPGEDIVDPSLPRPVKVKRELRMGSGPRGTFGPVRQLPDNSDIDLNDVGWWSASGTSLYEIQYTTTKPALGEKARMEEHWYEWDGQTPNATALKNRPTDTMIAHPPKPSILPVRLRSGTLPLPSTLKHRERLSLTDNEADPPHEEATSKLPAVALVSPAQAPPPDNSPPAQNRKTADQETVLHPLYLEAVETPTSDSAPDHSALIAPDAPTAALLADQSAVLYQSGGAVYVVPITHLNGAANARLQKTLAQQTAKTIGKAILMYTQDYDDVFPLQNNFADIVNPYLKNEEALKNFTYTNPNVPLGSVKFPATTIMGYLTAPGGRVVVYVDGHVQWQNTL